MSISNLEHQRIFVAGHRGMVGSAVVRALRANGGHRLITRTHAELDLTDGPRVRALFDSEAPEIVVLCAARVGGILANSRYPAELIQTNLAIQTNVLHEAWRSGVARLVFLGSSCIYPRDCAQPIKEEYLLGGPLEATNRAYAVAKIAGIEMCWSYNRQFGTRFLALMPTNLYGPCDNYDLDNCHVLPALLRKLHEAKCSGSASITAWGTGRPRREFLHSDDLAAAIVHVLGLPAERFEPLFNEVNAPILNVGTGKDIAITELVELIRSIVDYRGKAVWDRNRPDGTPRKVLDVARLRTLGWRPKIPLREGIERVYEEYCERRAALL